MKGILTILILFISYNIQAHEFYTAKVLLANGTVIDCKATLPENELVETSIKIKENDNKPATLIMSDEIYQILYVINDNNYIFERHNMGLIKEAYQKHRTNNSSGKEWYLIISSDNFIKAYISAQNYYLDKGKGVISTYSFEGRNINFGTSYLLKRKNENAPTVISMSNISYSQFRKWASEYFKEIPELVERINNKEFKKSEVGLLASAYSSYQPK